MEPLAATDRVMRLLATGDYAGVVRLTNGRRLDEAAIRRAIEGYRYPLAVPPDATWRDWASVVPVRTAVVTVPTWSVWVECWTVAEGRSDLGVRLTVGVNDDFGVVEVKLDDIRVA